MNTSELVELVHIICPLVKKGISKNDPLELIILIAAFYGLRRSEVLGLQWDSFDFENKTITIKHTITITNTDGNNRKTTGFQKGFW